MEWIPAFAGMTERTDTVVIPDLIGNPVFLIVAFGRLM